jgi:LacI family transcriptional regulator
MVEPRITLIQVAERAGVSKTTAGYVLTGQDKKMRIGEQTRHKVLRAAAEMNYRPNLMARSLRATVTRPIAIISDTLVTEPYGGELIGGCLAAAARHGRLTFIGETRRDPHLEAALIEEFLTEQVTDFVFVTVYPREVVGPAHLQQQGMVVTLNCVAEGDGSTAVLPDEVEAGSMAARVLLDAGIGGGICLVGDRADHPYAPGCDREQGIRRTLHTAGIDIAESVDCAWEPEAAYDAVTVALANGLQPTAFICMNDRAALGTYQALNNAGLSIPDDVSVLAFEGSDLATWMKPQLTTIDRQLDQMGRRAIELLIDDPQTHVTEHVPLTLRPRRSVGIPVSLGRWCFSPRGGPGSR